MFQCHSPKLFLSDLKPKETKDLYTENYKTLVKEIKEDTNRWRNIPWSWLGRLNIVKMSVLPKAILQIQCNPYQATSSIFHRTRTNNFNNLYGNTKNLELPKQS